MNKNFLELIEDRRYSFNEPPSTDVNSDSLHTMDLKERYMIREGIDVRDSRFTFNTREKLMGYTTFLKHFISNHPKLKKNFFTLVFKDNDMEKRFLTFFHGYYATYVRIIIFTVFLIQFIILLFDVFYSDIYHIFDPKMNVIDFFDDKIQCIAMFIRLGIVFLNFIGFIFLQFKCCWRRKIVLERLISVSSFCFLSCTFYVGGIENAGFKGINGIYANYMSVSFFLRNRSFYRYVDFGCIILYIGGYLYLEKNLLEFFFVMGCVILCFVLAVARSYLNEYLNRKTFVMNYVLTKIHSDFKVEHFKKKKILGHIFPKRIIPRVRPNVVQIITKTPIMCVSIDKIDQVNPSDVLNFLHELYCGFDTVVRKCELEKIKSVGRKYLCFEYPKKNVLMLINDPVWRILHVGLWMLGYFKQRKDGQGKEFENAEIRIGISCGKVFPSVLGIEMLQFEVYGTAVEESKILAKDAIAHRVNVSKEVYEISKKVFRFQITKKINFSTKIQVLNDNNMVESKKEDDFQYHVKDYGKNEYEKVCRKLNERTGGDSNSDSTIGEIFNVNPEELQYDDTSFFDEDKVEKDIVSNCHRFLDQLYGLLTQREVISVEKINFFCMQFKKSETKRKFREYENLNVGRYLSIFNSIYFNLYFIFLVALLFVFSPFSFFFLILFGEIILSLVITGVFFLKQNIFKVYHLGLFYSYYHLASLFLVNITVLVFCIFIDFNVYLVGVVTTFGSFLLFIIPNIVMLAPIIASILGLITTIIMYFLDKVSPELFSSFLFINIFSMVLGVISSYFFKINLIVDFKKDRSLRRKYKLLEEEIYKNKNLLQMNFPELCKDYHKNEMLCVSEKAFVMFVIIRFVNNTNLKFFSESSEDLIDEYILSLNKNFIEFDSIVIKKGLKKIRIYGSKYFCILNHRHGGEEVFLDAAKEMLSCFLKYSSNSPEKRINTYLTIGGGILGKKKRNFELFGEGLDLSHNCAKLCKQNSIICTREFVDLFPNRDYFEDGLFAKLDVDDERSEGFQEKIEVFYVKHEIPFFVC